MSHSIDKELIQDEVIRTTDVLSGPVPEPIVECEGVDSEDEESEDTDVFEDAPVIEFVCLKCGKQITVEDGFCPHCNPRTE